MMSCCCGKKTDGKELQSIKIESNPSSEKIKIIPPKKSSDSEIEYSITIKTGDNRNSSTDGPVYIKIFGRDDKQTDDILLTSPFRQDSIKKIQIKAIDIGKPQRIIIRHEDKTNGWFIDYVEISVHNFLIRFVANRWLSESKHDRKISAELFGSEQPAADYNIEIQTGNEQIQPLDSPVYMQIFGTITTTPKLFLESKYASFTKDSIAKFNISSNNVGEIQKIVIGHENLGTINDWYLQNIKIQTAGQQYQFPVNKWLSPTKDDKQLFIELNYQPSPPLLIYLITIRTIDVQRTDAIDNIEMNIHGSHGEINKILLKDFVQSNEQEIFQKGSLDQFEIKEKDIGNIENITIGFNDNQQKAALLFEYINIKYKETIYHFRIDYWLSSRLGPNFSWMTVQLDRNNDGKIIIQTGESGITANVMLCIYGDKDISKMIALRQTKNDLEAKFDQNSRLEFDLKEIDVGKIEKINIGHDGKGNDQKWFLKFIEIEKKNEHYIFIADRYLSEETENFIDLLPKPSSPKKDQIIYIITIITSSENDSGTDSGVFMTIYGDKDRTKQFQLIKTKQNSELLFKQNEINQFEIELNDVGNIIKINIGQDGKGLHPIWHLETVQIQKESEIYKFNVDQVLDFSMPDIDLTPSSPELPVREKTPSPEPIKSSTPRSHISGKQVKISEIMYKQDTKVEILPSETSTIVVKTKDTDYEIKTTTGETTFNGSVIIKIRGEYGIINIPLSKTKSENKPFQSKAIDIFTSQTTDVGKIKRITIELNEIQVNDIWYLKKIQIIKGNETYNFNGNVRLDYKEQKANLHPIPQQKEDYVQSELRRLRDNLQTESSKMRRPRHKAHEPFVYNDLSPYFDTSTVEKAIHEPLETPPGYYTRLTALRIVEPWEAYGMDYGVSYELFKRRKNRGHSAKRSTKKTDDNIDRTQGSTYLPEFPCVNIQKPAEYQRPLTLNDVPKIRSFVRNRYTAKANGQIEKDYKRTRDDFYRMQLDNVIDYHETNRDNMIRVYHSYLENTPGSKKAVHDLCEQIPLNTTKTTV